MQQSWNDGVTRQATLDALEQYRYSLVRSWGPNKSRVCFVMLNPSTADAYQDDATIRRCIGFSKAWGFDSLEVVNLYAWRATDPKDLWKAIFPIGSENDRYTQEAVRRSSCVVVAWGAGAKCQHRVSKVQKMIKNAFCLARTKNGAPHHPLRLPADIKPSIYLRDGIVIP
jgi:hypothetical protein